MEDECDWFSRVNLCRKGRGKQKSRLNLRDRESEQSTDQWLTMLQRRRRSAAEKLINRVNEQLNVDGFVSKEKPAG